MTFPSHLFSETLAPSVLFPQPRDMVVRLNELMYGKHVIEQGLVHNKCYMSVCCYYYVYYINIPIFQDSFFHRNISFCKTDCFDLLINWQNGNTTNHWCSTMTLNHVSTSWFWGLLLNRSFSQNSWRNLERCFVCWYLRPKWRWWPSLVWELLMKN